MLKQYDKNNYLNEIYWSYILYYIWSLQYNYYNITELKLGGLIYVSGLIFFKSDGRIPCAHAIWHLFVAAAAGFHYYAILNHVYPQKDSDFLGPSDNEQLVLFKLSKAIKSCLEEL